MTRTFQLNDWSFDATGHALSRGDEIVRLEFRAAALLSLLCERRSEIVSQREILDSVWDGRHVSPNSVPVVIADLRRALGDDARQPRFIETVNKGGYRLVADGPKSQSSRKPMTRWALAGAGVVAVVAMTAASMSAVSNVTTIQIEKATNATGVTLYDPLVAAVGGQVLNSVAGHAELQATDGPAPLGLETKLVLWSGKPEILLTAKEKATGEIAWTSAVFVPEDRIPGAVAQAIDKMNETLKARKRRDK